MNTNNKNQSISDYNFLTLLISTIILKEQSPIIINHKLEKILYNYSNKQEYQSLFQNIYKNDDDNYVDLNNAFEKAYLIGIILQIHDYKKETKSVINISSDEAIKIQSKFKQEYINTISNMCDDIYDLKDNKKDSFNVLAIPYNRPFIVSPNKAKELKKRKK